MYREINRRHQTIQRRVRQTCRWLAKLDRNIIRMQEQVDYDRAWFRAYREAYMVDLDTLVLAAEHGVGPFFLERPPHGDLDVDVLVPVTDPLAYRDAAQAYVRDLWAAALVGDARSGGSVRYWSTTGQARRKSQTELLRRLATECPVTVGFEDPDIEGFLDSLLAGS